MEKKIVTTIGGQDLLEALALMKQLEKRINRLLVDEIPKCLKEGKQKEAEKLNKELGNYIKSREDLIKLLEGNTLLFSDSNRKNSIDKVTDNIPQNSTFQEKNETLPKLKPIQETFVYLIVQGNSFVDIARELRVDRTTLYNWLDKEGAL